MMLRGRTQTGYSHRTWQDGHDGDLARPRDGCRRAKPPRVHRGSVHRAGPGDGRGAGSSRVRRLPNYGTRCASSIVGCRSRPFEASTSMTKNGSTIRRFPRSSSAPSTSSKGDSATEALVPDVADACERLEHLEHCRPRVSTRALRGVKGAGLSGVARLTFDEPVFGPIVIGRSRYLGGGVFAAF
jgi:hypothetical protein